MPEGTIPVITIDGPGGSGKGTISQHVARELGWHYLDSGALYRLVALAAQRQGAALDDEPTLARLASQLDVQFLLAGAEQKIMLDKEDVGVALRSEACGNSASKAAVLPTVRQALLSRQKAFRTVPGLVADGRDMGSVVFPDASLKIFLTASVQERAVRRYKQLKDKGMDVNINDLAGEITERDARDEARSVAPMGPAPGALIVDSSGLAIEDVVQHVLRLWQRVLARSS